MNTVDLASVVVREVATGLACKKCKVRMEIVPGEDIIYVRCPKCKAGCGYKGVTVTRWRQDDEV